MVLSKRAAEFSLNGCGAHWLAIDGSNVKGVIDEGVTARSLAELEERVVEGQRKDDAFKGG